MNRRDFIQFLGRSGVAAPFAQTLIGLSVSKALAQKKVIAEIPFLAPSSEDVFQVAQGIKHYSLIQFDEVINLKGEKFGDHNDYLAYHPIGNKKNYEGYFWVNHEQYDIKEISEAPKSKAKIDLERSWVGGSLLKIKKNKTQWQIIKNDPVNRRYTGFTEIALSQPVLGTTKAIGTMANCSGGYTPWGTFLSCEENYNHFVGQVQFDEKGQRSRKPLTPFEKKYSWLNAYELPPEHYGWVVEINPTTGQAIKHISLGRFAHESACVVLTKEGYPVVYMGDDSDDQYFYKFVSSEKDSLLKGTLYVANFEKGIWLPLDVEKNEKLKTKYKTQVELLIRTREAAADVGATPLDRPEDCEIDPITNHIIIACTNNKAKKNYFGSMLRVKEFNNDYSASTFTWEVFKSGGEDSGFACPDNLCFDKKGNLWMTTDIADEALGITPYEKFKNNSLFYIPLQGREAGKVYRIANAPLGAELTGPFFLPDDETLVLSIQHPRNMASRVVALHGETMKSLLKDY